MRLLIQHVESISVSLEFDINPALEDILENLLEEAAPQANTPPLKSRYDKAQDAVESALDLVATPLAKLAAMIGALETILDSFSKNVK